MSVRANGSPIWRIRPIINGVIDESRAILFRGTLAKVDRETRRLHRETGIEHAARELRS